MLKIMGEKNLKNITLSFKQNSKKEREIYDYLNTKFNKSSFIKELIFKEMTREGKEVILKNEINTENQDDKELINNKTKDKKSGFSKFSSLN